MKKKYIRGYIYHFDTSNLIRAGTQGRGLDGREWSSQWNHFLVQQPDTLPGIAPGQGSSAGGTASLGAIKRGYNITVS